MPDISVAFGKFCTGSVYFLRIVETFLTSSTFTSIFFSSTGFSSLMISFSTTFFSSIFFFSFFFTSITSSETLPVTLPFLRFFRVFLTFTSASRCLLDDFRNCLGVDEILIHGKKDCLFLYKGDDIGKFFEIYGPRNLKHKDRYEEYLSKPSRLS